MTVLLSALLVLLALGGMAFAAAVHTVRAVGRRVERWQDRAVTSVRAMAAGPAGEAARTRRELRATLDGARRALAVARATGAPVGEVPGLLSRLELAAHRVDGELRVVAEDPDATRATARLVDARSRARALGDAAGSLHAALAEATGPGWADLEDVGALRAECDLERRALRAARTERPRLPT